MGYERLKSIDELKELCHNLEQAEIFISLNGGARSSKTVMYDENEDVWNIHHEIDGEFEELNTAELEDSFLGKAISQGAVYKY